MISVSLLARLANLALLGAIAWSAAWLTWLVWTPDAPPVQVPVALDSGASTGTPTALPRLADVAALHLFGRSDTVARDDAPAQPIDAPETRLDLTLRGLVATGNPNRAFAIIATPDGEERPYRAGDKVAGQATVEEIRRDHVLLKRSGRYETLRLPKERLNEQQASAASRPSAVTPTQARQLDYYRERLMNDPSRALDLVRVRPITEDGRLKGYRLAPRSNPELFQALGLESGDIVTAINGQSLDNPAAMGQLMNGLSSAGSVSLEVERGGQRQQLNIDLSP